jgi:hypothetical protein
MAVCFDTAAPTERHIDFADYKANRQEAPEDLLASLPDIRKIIEGLNIPIIETDGFEADDVIGTLAKQAEKEKKFSSVMISQSVKTGTKHRGFYFVYEVGKDAIRYLPIGKTNSELERERAFRKNGELTAISPETGRIVETFRSIADAVDKGFTRTGILNSKRDGSRHRGYIWKYEKK